MSGKEDPSPLGRGRGRPPLEDGQKSIDVHLRLAPRDYDKASALAQQHRTSVAGIFRAAFRLATRRQDKLDP